MWVVPGFLGGGQRISRKDRKGDVETKKSVLGGRGYPPSTSCLAFKPRPRPGPISGPLCVSCVGGPRIPRRCQRIPKKDRKGDVETKKSVLAGVGTLPPPPAWPLNLDPNTLAWTYFWALGVSCMGGPRIPRRWSKDF